MPARSTVLYACRFSKQMASARYRAHRWAERLERRGHRVRLLYRQRVGYRSGSPVRKLAFLPAVLAHGAAADTVVFQKYAPPVFVQRRLRHKHIVFDFDDRIYKTSELRDERSRFPSMLRASSRVIVSTDTLRDEIAGHQPWAADRIAVIPSLIERRDFDEAAAGRAGGGRDRVVIGWVGTSHGFRYVRSIEPALARLCRERGPRVEVVIVSDRPYRPETRGLRVTNVRWRLEREHACFTDFDISIMPLEDAGWARCKAGFKAIQSLAARLPVVASPVGLNREIIRHGRNGFLAASCDEFYAALRALVDDESLRRRLGDAGYASAARWEFPAWEEEYLRQVLPAR